MQSTEYFWDSFEQFSIKDFQRNFMCSFSTQGPKRAMHAFAVRWIWEELQRLGIICAWFVIKPQGTTYPGPASISWFCCSKNRSCFHTLPGYRAWDFSPINTFLFYLCLSVSFKTAVDFVAPTASCTHTHHRPFALPCNYLSMPRPPGPTTVEAPGGDCPCLVLPSL